MTADRGKHVDEERRTVLRPIQPLVSNDTPNIDALTVVAATVRFNAFEILVTPVFFFASDFNSRTSVAVHARLTNFSTISAPVDENRASSTAHLVCNARSYICD